MRWSSSFRTPTGSLPRIGRSVGIYGSVCNVFGLITKDGFDVTRKHLKVYFQAYNDGMAYRFDVNQYIKVSNLWLVWNAAIKCVSVNMKRCWGCLTMTVQPMGGQGGGSCIDHLKQSRPSKDAIASGLNNLAQDKHKRHQWLHCFLLQIL